MHKWCNMAITTALLFVALILNPMLAKKVKFFDYFQLVQQWPMTYCDGNDKCNRHPLPNYFTLHGLWPDQFNRVLLHCGTKKNAYKKYDEDDPPERLNIRKRLDRMWTDFGAPDAAAAFVGQIFWKHEWEKHGTCSLNRYSQDEYFDLALKLKDKHDIMDMLQKYDITPGSRYLAKNFTDAIQRSTACEADIHCKQISEDNYQLLELIICYAPNGRHCIDCPYFSRFWKCGHEEDFLKWKKKKEKKKAAKKKKEKKDADDPKKKGEDKVADDPKKKGEEKDADDPKKKGEEKDAVDSKKKGEGKDAVDEKKKRIKKGYILVDFPSP